MVVVSIVLVVVFGILSVALDGLVVTEVVFVDGVVVGIASVVCIGDAVVFVVGIVIVASGISVCIVFVD